MSNPVTKSFFVGRATAEALTEKIEDALADLFSSIAKFDAQQRQNLREFVAIVQAKVEQEMGEVSKQNGVDAQELIDNLRAEIAQLKAELQKYRHNSQ
jgi:GTP1/Obg family GTP-binding protein